MCLTFLLHTCVCNSFVELTCNYNTVNSQSFFESGAAQIYAALRFSIVCSSSFCHVAGAARSPVEYFGVQVWTVQFLNVACCWRTTTG